MPPTTDPEFRRRRRALLRRHHPDLGGDPTEFVRILALLDRSAARTGPGAVAGDEVRFVRRPRGLARLSAWLRGRRARARRPPRVV